MNLLKVIKRPRTLIWIGVWGALALTTVVMDRRSFTDVDRVLAIPKLELVSCGGNLIAQWNYFRDHNYPPEEVLFYTVHYSEKEIKRYPWIEFRSMPSLSPTMRRMSFSWLIIGGLFLLVSLWPVFRAYQLERKSSDNLG